MTALREWTGTTLVALGYHPSGLRSIASYANGVVTSYAYDPIGRLTGLTLDLIAPGQDVTFAYAHNPASQIVSRDIDNDSYVFPKTAASTGYAVNGLNQYTQVGAGTVLHDPNGNLIAEGGRTLGYDSENKLVSATSAAGGTPFNLGYDPQGRFRAILFGTMTTGIDMVGTDIVALRVDAGPPVERYVFAPGVDEPMVGYNSAGTRYFFHADGHGNVIARSDGAGMAIKTIGYDEYGRPSSYNSRFLHAGKMHLGTIMAYYNNARFYDYNLGRFLQTDPIRYKDQMNLYAYVGNDPINGADPSGLYTCEESECRTVSKAVQALARAAQNARINNTGSRLPSQAARVLTSAVKALGTEGKGGIHIQNAQLEAGTWGQHSRRGNGGHLIEMDFHQIAKQGGIPIAAAVLGHEVTHAAQDTRHGPPTTLENLSLRERQAYRVGAWTMEALGWHHPNLPSMSDKDFEGSIRGAAKDNCLSSAIDYEYTHGGKAMLPGNCQ